MCARRGGRGVAHYCLGLNDVMRAQRKRLQRRAGHAVQCARRRRVRPRMEHEGRVALRLALGDGPRFCALSGQRGKVQHPAVSNVGKAGLAVGASH